MEEAKSVMEIVSDCEDVPQGDQQNETPDEMDVLPCGDTTKPFHFSTWVAYAIVSVVCYHRRRRRFLHHPMLERTQQTPHLRGLPSLPCVGTCRGIVAEYANFAMRWAVAPCFRAQQHAWNHKQTRDCGASMPVMHTQKQRVRWAPPVDVVDTAVDAVDVIDAADITVNAMELQQASEDDATMYRRTPPAPTRGNASV